MSGGPGSDSRQTMVRSTPLEWARPNHASSHHSCAQTAPAKRRIRPLFAADWGVEVFMGGLSTRRFFAFGLVAAGAVPLASRLRFSSANAVAGAVRAVPIAPVVPKTFKAFGGVRI